jgi:hypothetical protein
MQSCRSLRVQEKSGRLIGDEMETIRTPSLEISDAPFLGQIVSNVSPMPGNYSSGSIVLRYRPWRHSAGKVQRITGRAGAGSFSPHCSHSSASSPGRQPARALTRGRTDAKSPAFTAGLFVRGPFPRTRGTQPVEPNHPRIRGATNQWSRTIPAYAGQPTSGAEPSPHTRGNQEVKLAIPAHARKPTGEAPTCGAVLSPRTRGSVRSRENHGGQACPV